MDIKIRGTAGRFLRSKWFFFLLVFGFSQPVLSGEYLSAQAIKNLISGRSMTFYGNYGAIKFQGAAHWKANGTISGYTMYLGKKRNWSGTWYVRDNQYCRNLSGEGHSDFQCMHVQKINSNTIRFIKSDGSVSSTSILE